MIGFCLFNMLVNLFLVIKEMVKTLRVWIRKKNQGEEEVKLEVPPSPVKNLAERAKKDYKEEVKQIALSTR